MARKPGFSYATFGGVLAAVVGLLACDGGPNISLTKTESIEDLPVPAADGPKLGSVANVTPIRKRPEITAELLGYLHAGARVARAAEPYGYKGCKGGWYPVRPRGFVCADTAATTDLEHPTLVAMGIQPNLAQNLPYTYARTRKATALFEVDPDRDRGVRMLDRKLASRSGLAVVGSWSATDDQGAEQSLAMMTDGRFVATEDLEAASPSEFAGVEIGEKIQLPVAFVVKRGIRYWDIQEAKPKKGDKIDYHTQLTLTGKYRKLLGVKYWEIEDGRFVRHKDVTVAHKRTQFPSFVTPTRKWIDISVITGAAVLYEGEKPVFATLASVGRDRDGDPENTDSTALGEFPVVFKHTTLAHADPSSFATNVDIFDVPWALELESGQVLHGAYWHNRFGIEHGPGNIQLSPADARRIWHWVDTEVPENWHGAVAVDADSATFVNIRK